MSKNCKVISAYFGPRRKYPNGITDTINYWNNRIINRELEIDPGVDMDTIIVNHDYGNKEVSEYLDTLNGKKTKCGVIRVYNRPWENGVGGSYKSFSEGYRVFREKYDNWFFTEDTVVPILNSYYKIALEQLDSDDDLAFVCCLRAGGMRHPNKHCDGGCGLTNKEYLDVLFNKFGRLPHSDKTMVENIQNGIKTNNLKVFKLKNEIKTQDNSWYHDFCYNGEVKFTNQFLNEGFKIKDLNLNNVVIEWRDKKI